MESRTRQRTDIGYGSSPKTSLGMSYCHGLDLCSWPILLQRPSDYSYITGWSILHAQGLFQGHLLGIAYRYRPTHRRRSIHGRRVTHRRRLVHGCRPNWRAGISARADKTSPTWLRRTHPSPPIKRLWLHILAHSHSGLLVLLTPLRRSHHRRSHHWRSHHWRPGVVIIVG